MVDEEQDHPIELIVESEQPETPPVDAVPEEPTEFLHAGTIDWPAKQASPDTRESEYWEEPLFPKLWNTPIVRIFAYLCLFFLLEFVASQFIAPWATKLRAHKNSLDDIGEAIAAFSAVAPLWLMVHFAERRRLGDAGFTARGVVVDTVSGYAIGMGVISVAIGFMGLFGLYHITSTNAFFRPWMPLVVLLFTAVAEESVFRGMVYRVLEYRYGSLVALIVSSLFFGLAHIANGFGIVGPLFISFEAGLLLAAAYMATRRLWLGIGIHWAWNFFEGPIYGAQDSGLRTPNTLVNATFHGPTLLTGGIFGPEASVIALIVCTFAGLLLLRVAVRAGQWKPAGEWQPQSLPKRARREIAPNISIEK